MKKFTLFILTILSFHIQAKVITDLEFEQLENDIFQIRVTTNDTNDIQIEHNDSGLSIHFKNITIPDKLYPKHELPIEMSISVDDGNSTIFIKDERFYLSYDSADQYLINVLPFIPIDNDEDYSIDFESIPAITLLEILMKKQRIRPTSIEPLGNVGIHVDHVNPKLLITTLLELKNWQTYKIKDHTLIASPDKISSIKEALAKPGISHQFFRLKYKDSNEVFLSKDGKVFTKSDNALLEFNNHTILLIDTPKKIKQLENLVNTVDIPYQIEFEIQLARSIDFESLLCELRSTTCDQYKILRLNQSCISGNFYPEELPPEYFEEKGYIKILSRFRVNVGEWQWKTIETDFQIRKESTNKQKILHAFKFHIKAHRRNDDEMEIQYSFNQDQPVENNHISTARKGESNTMLKKGLFLQNGVSEVGFNCNPGKDLLIFIKPIFAEKT